MRYLVILSSLILLSFSSSTPTDRIIGVWLSQIKDSKIEIFKCNGKYHGKVVWINHPNDENGKPLKDIKNPIEKLRVKPIMNLIILKNLVFKDDEWIDGTIYDPKQGKTYDCKVWLENGNLKLRGYLGWLFDTKTWTRV